jgi:hypothetical protein
MGGGNGGSSGGGGSSGAVSYPAYLETVHSEWINDAGADILTQSLADTMNSAFGNSPWTGLTAYDPSADITAYDTVMTAYKVILAGIIDTTDWSDLYTHAKNTIDNAVDITADVTAFSDILDDEITTKTLPRFKRGMQDINAVVSSAFVIGEAIIEGFRDRDVAKYTSALMLNNHSLIMTGTEQMMRLMLQRIGWEENYVKMYIEGKRIKIVAKKEQTDQDAKIDEEDALWDMEVFQYGGNLLAAIGGGVSTPNTKQPSRSQSMLGGALSGAAAGAMISGGNPIGAIAGGVLGAASSFL